MATLQKSLLPFDYNFKTDIVEEGITIREAVKRNVPAIIDGSQIIVTVNNQVVREELWDVVCIKDNMVVGINVVPTGGGSARKITATVLAATIAVLTTIYAPAIAGFVFGSASKLAVGTVIVTGSLAASLTTAMLAQTPKQSNLNSSSVKDSTTQFIEGASNAVDRFGVIPVNLGTNRMFPKQAALPYTEASGMTSHCRQLFTYGYGNLQIEDRKLGETPLSQYSDYQIEDRLRGDLHLGTSLYTNDVYQDNYGVTIANSAGWIERTTQRDAEEMSVDIVFQNGLVHFDNNGNKQWQSVEFEIQYKPVDVPDWVEPEDITVNAQTAPQFDFGFPNSRLILNIETGAVTYTSGVAPSGWIQIGHWQYYGAKVQNFIDDRAPYIGTIIKNPTDFAFSGMLSCTRRYVVAYVNVGAGTLIGKSNKLTVTNATTSAFFVSKRYVLPTKGQYNVRIRRITGDNSATTISDVATLYSIKSVSSIAPVNQKHISGTAIYIKATDQLNGTIDKYNAIVTTLVKSYDTEDEVWNDNRPSSNPADLFRYVLQSPAFVKALPDNRIDIAKLEEWAKYCEDNNLTYNRIIDYEASVDEVLNDICAAGVATLSRVDGNYSVIIDNERPIIKGLVTPRNSSNYRGSIVYQELPHALRVQFRNKEAGYELDERIVFDTGYDETNAEIYERIEFLSCTDKDLAYWYAKRYFATAKLQPETHTFKMDFENLTFGRGDRISFVNDVILVGAGQGRIKELIVDNVTTPTIITGFTVDDEIAIPTSNNLAVRIRHSSGSGFTYHLLTTVSGSNTEFMFATPVPYTTSIGEGSLCAFVEDGKELDLIITEIKPSTEQTATVTCIDYAPARFNPIGEIPPWESNVSIPADFFTPLPPLLDGYIQTDETVMIKNSDGSFTSVMVVPLKNRNEDNVIPILKYKTVESNVWSTATYVKRDPTDVVITGLTDGVVYDLEIRYQRSTGLQQLSQPLILNSVRFIGGSNPPADVKNFTVTVSGYTGLFEWKKNPDNDISHYQIRYTNSFTDVVWRNMSVLADNIAENRVSLPIRAGTYLIKAKDLLGNESVNATSIISTDEGAFNNVVEDLTQQTAWAGVFDRTHVTDGKLYLDDNESEGYYYFSPAELDLGAVYEVMMSSTLIAFLQDEKKIRTVSSIRSLASVRLLNINVPWTDNIEMNLSTDGINWTGWKLFTTARQQFRYAKFRIHLAVTDLTTHPRVDELAVYIDMPDRRESGTGLSIVDPDTGYTVSYRGAFKNNPAVNITVQNGEADDKLVYENKNSSGFTIKVFNDTLNAYVSRVFDYTSSGYGRVL